MKLQIDMEKIYKDFPDGKIKAFMKEYNLTELESVLYLYGFNYISISPDDRNKNCGREMYLKFAKGMARILEQRQA